MNNYAYITVTSKAVVFEGPYKQGFVEALKKAIPHIERSWEPDLKIWKVGRKHLGRLSDMVKEHYKRCLLVEGAVSTNLHTGQVVEQMTLWERSE